MQNTFFSFFFILTPHTSLMHNFLIHLFKLSNLTCTFSFIFQIEQFKWLWNHHLNLYKSFCNSKGDRGIFEGFLRGSEIGYELFDQEFSVKKTPPISRGCNFLTSCQILPIFRGIDVPRGGLHLLFGHHKQWGPPPKTVSKPYIKCSVMGCSTLLVLETESKTLLSLA